MRHAAIVLVVLAASAWSCGKPEWAIPRSGEAACMCSVICACGMSQNEQSQKERTRCFDACSCDVCPGEQKPVEEKPAEEKPSDQK